MQNLFQNISHCVICDVEQNVKTWGETENCNHKINLVSASRVSSVMLVQFCTWPHLFIRTPVTTLLAVRVCFTPTAFRTVSPCLGTFSYRLMQLWSLAADVTVWWLTFGRWWPPEALHGFLTPSRQMFGLDVKIGHGSVRPHHLQFRIL
jgi:hypothetical protein